VAAASSDTGTGTIILGIVLLVLFLAFLYWVVRRILRLILWPFRAMRRPAPSGLGSEYEQMVARTRKVGSAQEQRVPFPPEQRHQPSAQPPAGSRAEPAAPPPRGAVVFRSRAAARWSWILSVLASLLVIGTASSIVSPFAGLTVQDAVSGAALLFVVAPWWFWLWRRGRLPVIRVGSAGAAEAAAFREWSTARANAELAEFQAWRAARDAGRAAVASHDDQPPPNSMIDTF
jgi:hypothetical protein